MKLPLYLKKYFWDADFENLDPQKNRSYIVSRILEYGDDKAVKWAFQSFSREDIKKTLRESRILSPKSGNFWAAVFNLNKADLRSLQKAHLKVRASHWID